MGASDAQTQEIDVKEKINCLLTASLISAFL